MNVSYKKAFGIALVTVGGLNLILNLAVRNFTVGLFSGGIAIAAGIAFLTRKYFVLEDTRIVVNALLGPASRSYVFDSYDDLIVDERERVYLKQGNDMRKLPLSRMIANSDDWASFIATVRGT